VDWEWAGEGWRRERRVRERTTKRRDNIAAVVSRGLVGKDVK